MKKKSRIMAVIFCLALISVFIPISTSAANDTTSVSICPKCGMLTLSIRPMQNPTCISTGRGVEYCGNNRCRYEGAYVTLPATGKHTYITYRTQAASCSQEGYVLQRCSVCRAENREALAKTAHTWTALYGDCTKTLRCSVCYLESAGYRNHTYTDSSDTTCNITGCKYTRAALSKSEKNIEDMNNYAFKVYLVIRSICVPLAIISFASCGFKIIGSIFLGNFAVANNDILKAQKQFVYTILALMFIILLPKIFGAAIDFFSATGWEP